MKLGFDFVPFPKDIWTDGLDLSQAEFRLLGWFCSDLKWGIRRLEVTDEDILNGCEKEGRRIPAVGLSRNGMKKARECLVDRGMLIAMQITDGGGRGKSTSWAYSLNLSESDKNTETCHSVTNNPSQRDTFPPVNLSERDTAIRKERESKEEPELSSPPVTTEDNFQLNGDDIPNHQKKKGDPRHVPFKKHLIKFWLHVNPEFTEYRWDAGDAGQLGKFLEKWPVLTLGGLHTWLEHYRDSEGTVTTKTPKQFLPGLHEYAIQPLDQYRKPIQEKRVS